MRIALRHPDSVLPKLLLSHLLIERAAEKKAKAEENLISYFCNYAENNPSFSDLKKTYNLIKNL